MNITIHVIKELNKKLNDYIFLDINVNDIYIHTGCYILQNHTYEQYDNDEWKTWYTILQSNFKFYMLSRGLKYY